MSLQPSSLSLLFIRVSLLFGSTINASRHVDFHCAMRCYVTSPQVRLTV